MTKHADRMHLFCIVIALLLCQFAWADLVKESESQNHVEEMEIEIEGLEIAGGRLDDAIDAGKPLGVHPEPVADEAVNSSATDHPSLEDQIREALTQQLHSNAARGDGMKMYCNDGKFGVSLADAMHYILPAETDLPGVIDTVTQKLAESGGTHASSMRDKVSFIMESMFPSHMNTIKASLDTASEVSYNAIHSEIPTTALVSDGRFSLKGIRDRHSDSGGIRLIQRNYAMINFVCGLRATSYLGPLKSLLCSCSRDNSENFYSTNTNDDQAYEWCLQEISCENSKGDCEVVVDPFRTACIAYPEDALKEVTYDRVIPTLELSRNIANFGNSLAKVGIWIDDKVAMPVPVNVFEGFLANVGMFIDYIIQHMPTYLIRMAMGLWLLSGADELASNVLFQYVLAAVFGLLMAVIWIVLALYRTAENMFKAHMPMFLPGLGVAVLGPTWYLLGQQRIRGMIATYLFDFWFESWIGKVYFGVSMLLSIYFKHYFKLFAPKSNSAYVLKTLIQSLGCICLFFCTSNRELSVAFLLYGLLQEYVLYAYFRARLAYEVSHQKSSAAMMGRPLYSPTELRKLSEDATKRELEKLRIKLMTNPEYTSDLSNKLRLADKGEQATMLNRFINGAFHLAQTPLSGDNDLSDGEDDHVEFVGENGNSGAAAVGEKPPKKGRGIFTKLIITFIGLAVIGALGLVFQRNRTEALYAQLAETSKNSLPHIMRGLDTLTTVTKKSASMAGKLAMDGLKKVNSLRT